MSEHTKGRLSIDGALLRAENNNVVVNSSSRPRLWEGDLRRLAACWNAFEGISPPVVECIVEGGGMMALLSGASIKEKNLLAAQVELTAARALLREFLAEVDGWHKSEWGMLAEGDAADKVRNYLDACDTLGNGGVEDLP